ncbi:MAG: hypothetical protein OHK0044_03920 [Burkholderiaceae bacterium]
MPRRTSSAGRRTPGPLPQTPRDVEAVVRRCRKIVTRRALISAGAAVVPIPGIDVAVDLGMLMKMLNEINAAFGLTPAQIEALATRRRLTAYKAIIAIGSSYVGRIVTRELALALVKRVARRIVASATVKFVPLAGQALAAGLSFAAIKYIGDRHIEHCAAVANRVIDAEARRR